jgi:hypothetical protein
MGDSIRIERDPSFWRGILAHPDVRHVMRGIDPGAALDAVILNDTVQPIANEHGGWLFVQMDPFGRVFDLHAAFTPEGCGREAVATLKRGIELTDADVYVVYEFEDEPNSRPPLSFGFRQMGDGFHTFMGPAKCWVLTREAWEASPVRRRMH